MIGAMRRHRLSNDLYKKGYCHLFCPKCGNTTLFRPVPRRQKLKCSECGLIVPLVKGVKNVHTGGLYPTKLSFSLAKQETK